MALKANSHSRLELHQSGRRIGEGAYGSVFYARWYTLLDDAEARDSALSRRYNMREVVAKKISLQHSTMFSMFREIDALRRLRDCPNVIQLLDVVQLDEESRYLVLERMHQSLQQVMDAGYSHRDVGVSVRNKIPGWIKQMFLGIAHCHSKGILHLDLKPSNLLLDASSTVLKLADFGLSTCYQIPVNQTEPLVVTRWYRAPELLMGRYEKDPQTDLFEISHCNGTPPYSTGVDMWAAGCIVAALHRERFCPLFMGHDEYETLSNIVHLLGGQGAAVFSEYYSLPKELAATSGPIPLDEWEWAKHIRPSCKDIIANLIQYDPCKRPGAAEILRFPFFEECGV